MQAQAKSSDRRILTIGVTTMVVFLLVGVGSAAVFSRPACRLVAPTVSAYDVTTNSDWYGNDDALTRFADALTAFSSQPVNVVTASGVDRFTVLGDGVAAVGSKALVFDASAHVQSLITFSDADVVGSGDILYAVNIANPASGQVDAMQPFVQNGSALTCVELALVSTPLAFVKDAADGEVLFMRADEDGDEPFAEVRDAKTGRRLSIPLDLSVGSAGQHGIRTSGVLHPEVIVVTQQLTENADTTVVWGIDRQDGRIIFELTAATVGEALALHGEEVLTVRLWGEEIVLSVSNTDADRLVNGVTVAPDSGALTPNIAEHPLTVARARYATILAEHPDIELRDLHTLGGRDLLLVQTPTQAVIMLVAAGTR